MSAPISLAFTRYPAAYGTWAMGQHSAATARRLDSASRVPAGREVMASALLSTAGMTVSLQIDGTTLELLTTQATVGAALAEARIGIGPWDQVEPVLTATLVPDLVIKVHRVQREIQTVDETVPYQTLWVGDDALALDRREVRVAGTDGRQRTRTWLSYPAGQEMQVLHAMTWMDPAPVDRQIAFGKRITRTEFVTEDGNTLAYWRKIRMYATSYSASRAGTPVDAPWYGFTYANYRMRNGIVAMHRWIPLCTQVFVSGYGQGQVLDRGGGLNYYDIDLGYHDDDWRTWSKWVDVYLLWPPPADPDRIIWILPTPGSAWTGPNSNPDCISGRLGSRTEPCLCTPSETDK